MKEIQLTKGFITQVDDDMFEYLDQFKWHVCRNGDNVSACRWFRIDNKRTMVLMHRIIMKTPADLEVDHIDHHSLNNQRYNLRNCTRSQNAANRRGWSKSGYLGVTFCKGRKINKWQASIETKQHTYWGGRFKTKEEAARRYDELAILHFGEFANLNFK